MPIFICKRSTVAYLLQYRYGPFSTAHALLPKHLHIECLLNNMVLCDHVLNTAADFLKNPPSVLQPEGMRMLA